MVVVVVVMRKVARAKTAVVRALEETAVATAEVSVLPDGEGVELAVKVLTGTEVAVEEEPAAVSTRVSLKQTETTVVPAL